MENKVSYNLIADYYIALANCTGDLITNLKLQKLVFYTQAWYLAVTKKPLFDEDFQAWVHGPVLPELYFKYNQFKWKPILREDLDENKFSEISDKLTENTSLVEILSDVVNEYFIKTAYALEKSTHAEKPWIDARGGIPEDAPSTTIITKTSMIDYYSTFVIG